MTSEDVARRVETVFAEVFGGRLPFSPELTRADRVTRSAMALARSIGEPPPKAMSPSQV